ncbi:hypothetical protein GCM10010377_62710 [Streptomyces viridiviolaceus]|uniref:Extracellular solute-binding protein n=1 Tax=Streptomyces viridiviolaceus TaxID=68282 RepID=A0ABW2E1U3_9ACTN|nr:extracellular solute-binding protein [Streptomyces viridiviolaceus]GHB63144.1 hypothetical protein GCM10010377_62710 [Streptomyces viridiviolaceus]
MGADERAKRINQSIRIFEKKYPKIKVKTDFQDCASFRGTCQTRVAGGNPPDVFQNAVGFLRKYDKRGIPLDLKSRAAADSLSVEADPGRTWGDYVKALKTIHDKTEAPEARATSAARPCRPGTPSGPGRSRTTPRATGSRRDTAVHGLAAIEDLALLGDGMP